MAGPEIPYLVLEYIEYIADRDRSSSFAIIIQNTQYKSSWLAALAKSHADKIKIP